MRGPSAILRRVIAVVVDAIQRSACWALAHVQQEVLERVEPSVANADAPASVVSVLWARLQVAANLHARPRTVRFGVAPNSAMPMRRVRCLGAIKGEASAALSLSVLKVLRRNDLFCPAIAATQPVRASIRGRLRSRYYKKAPTTLMADVNRATLFGVSHVSYCNAVIGASA
jgi:hypothetical protein